MSPPLLPWRAQLGIFAAVALIASALSVAAFGAELATFTASEPTFHRSHGLASS